MLVALAEVALSNGDLAVGTVPELNPSIATCKVGADQLLAMLDILRYDKIGRLMIVEIQNEKGKAKH